MENNFFGCAKHLKKSNLCNKYENGCLKSTEIPLKIKSYTSTGFYRWNDSEYHKSKIIFDVYLINAPSGKNFNILFRLGKYCYRSLLILAKEFWEIEVLTYNPPSACQQSITYQFFKCKFNNYIRHSKCFNDISVNANLISVILKSKRQRINTIIFYLHDISTPLVGVVLKHIDQI